MPTQASYGSWKSPITTELITAKAISLIELAIDGDDIYWIESRPSEAGRYVIMRRTPDGKMTECTPSNFYARTTVHEYGGGAFTVADGVIYFANFKDQHLYRQRVGGQPELLTPGDGYRYADLVVDRKRNRLICIREDHTGKSEAVNTIVSIDLKGGDNGKVLVEGNNFYSYARLSPDGTKFAYQTWNHPNMPWDGSELWVADVNEDGTLGRARLIAGSATESVFQPEWSPDGVLHFVAETSGWWNLYRYKDNKVEALCPMEAEFGRPQWVFGMSTYGFVTPDKILCCYSQNSTWHLAWLDIPLKKLTPIESPFTDISDVQIGKGFAVFIAGSPTQPFTIWRMDTSSDKIESVEQAFEVKVDAGYLSTAEPITFPTTGGKEAHAIYYAPANKDFGAPKGERPPLMVISHGGPTSAAQMTLRYTIQYWTSRGFAVLDVNYGGSTGYGREYRQRLNGNWGVVDVDDCCNGALYLVEKGLADRNRLTIRGGSAGGYTTLACLTFQPDVFKAGASHYGLSRLEDFVTDTHKFESRYLVSLIGKYPEEKDLYNKRSPINYLNNLSCPLILFQGDEDKIVPPAQSQIMFEAVRAKELPVAYLLFEGEQHGFRKAQNIKRSLEAELYFYSKIFGFDLAEEIEPVEIEN
ncbi:MAG TPA: prolyl oligopeptidase family serine peptidase, partial [Anaerolineales bacterium]|nr:prolyl oligopeptidase family serine peptidase [Anaerolineales bacterium]